MLNGTGTTSEVSRLNLFDAAERLLEQKVCAGFDRTGITIDGSAAWDIRVVDPRFFRRVAKDGTLGLGESYMEGWWECSALDQLFHRLSLARRSRSRSAARYLTWLKSKVTNLQALHRARQVAEHHYDLDNELFEKMLDPWMQYSCGLWNDADNLADAQRHKLELICRKLELEPGDRVLEIGGGWGGLARYMAETRGCRVTSVNISREQMRFAREFTRGLPVDIVEMDYRKLEGKYDKVVSIAMFEAVGRKNFRRYMEVVHDCLTDDGIFLLHTIGDNLVRPYVDRWILKYIFPNGDLPAPSHLGTAIERLFVIEDWHNFGPDYDPTLMAWNRNFQDAWPSLLGRKAGFDERFRRMWTYYLLSSAGSFRGRNVQLWQLVMTRHKSGRIYKKPVY